MIRDTLTGHLRPHAPLSQAQPSDSSLPVPPPPRTVAEPRSNPTHLIVPAPPEPRPRPPSAKPAFGREDDSVRRINIPMACAVQDGPFLVVFRQNRISKKYHFLECTTMSSAPDRPAAETTSNYNLSELPFDQVPCLHCRVKPVGIIRCPAGHYVCTGRSDANYFRCCDSCGAHGPFSHDLHLVTVTGSETESARRPLLGRASNTQARLLSSTPIGLLPRR